jgi:hypothetical protein
VREAGRDAVVDVAERHGPGEGKPARQLLTPVDPVVVRDHQHDVLGRCGQVHTERRGAHRRGVDEHDLELAAQLAQGLANGG